MWDTPIINDYVAVRKPVLTTGKKNLQYIINKNTLKIKILKNQMISSFHEAPFLRPFIAIIMGVLIFDHISSSFNIKVVTILILLLLMLKLQKHQRYVIGQGALIVSFIIIIGGMRLDLKKNITPMHYSYNADTTEYFLYAHVITDPKVGTRIRAEADVQSIGSNIHNMRTSKGKVLLYFPKETTLSPTIHQRYLVKGRIRPIENNTNPLTFDWQGYLRKRGVTHQVYLTHGNVWFSKDSVSGNIPKLISNVRSEFQGILKKYIPKEEEHGIAMAMILGYRNHLDKDLYKSFTDTGAVHTLAVSGLHVGIMVAILSFIFGFLRKTSVSQKLLKSVILIVGVWSYALLTGGAPAITRASIMFTIMIVDYYWSSSKNMINSLCAAGFIMVLIDPYNIYKAGFQFSFFALAGILIFYKVIFSVIPYIRVKAIRYLWGLIAVSIAAQITVFPLTIYYFHKFPTYFWLSSLIAIPMAFVILSLGVGLIISTYLFPFLSPLLGDLVSAFINFLNTSIKAIQGLPVSSNDGIWLHTNQIILIYIILVVAALMLDNRKRIHFILIGLMGGALILGQSHNDIMRNRQLEFTVYDVYGGTVIDFVDGRKLFTYSNIPRSDDSEQYLCGNYRLYKGVQNIKYYELNEGWTSSRMISQKGITLANGYQIIIANDENIIPLNPIVDFLIVTDSFKGNPYVLLDRTCPKTVILDKSMDWDRFYKWKRILRYKNIHTINLFNDGATTINLKT